MTYLDIIMNIQELSRDVQAHSEASVTSANSEPWYIQNPGMFRNFYIPNPAIYRTLAYLEPERHSEPWYIKDLKHIQNPGKLVR